MLVSYVLYSARFLMVHQDLLSSELIFIREKVKM